MPQLFPRCLGFSRIAPSSAWWRYAGAGLLLLWIAVLLCIPLQVRAQPTFATTLYSFAFVEHQGSAVIVGSVSATDADSYSLIGGDTTRFNIGSANGVVSYVGDGVEDVTYKPSYTLIVRATNGGGDVQATVVVLVGICNRTSIVRSQILGQLSTNQCDEVTQALLQAITSTATLFLGNPLPLKPWDFLGLTNFRGSINLFGGNTTVPGESSGPTALPEGVFSDLHKLDRLIIGNLLIPSLPQGTFAGLSNVTEIYLGYGRLSALTADTFSTTKVGFTPMRHLETLGLINQHNADTTPLTKTLSEIPDGIFTGMTSLESIDLSLNSIDLAGLSEDLFAGLESLTMLELFNPNVSITEDNTGNYPVDITVQVDGTGVRVVSSRAVTELNVQWVASGGSGSDESGTAGVPAGGTTSAAVQFSANDHASIRLDSASFIAGNTNTGVALNVSTASFSLDVAAPVFEATSYAFTVSGSGLVGTVVATDANGDALTYGLVSGGSGVFSVSPADGVVSYSGGIVATTVSYTLAVSAQDVGGLSALATVEVVVSATAVAPAFVGAPYSFTLVENDSGTPTAVLIGTVVARDANAASASPSYSLSAGETSNFSVNSASGVVSYIGTGEDYETRSDAYTLTVRVTDGASAALFTTTPLVVTVTDVEEAPEFVDAPYSFTVTEGRSGTQSPVLIGTVVARDADAGSASPSYSLSAGATDRFSVGSASGVVSYIGTGEDFETRSDAYTLTVRATDGASTAVFTAAEVTVLISNENDNAPLFAAAPYSFTVPEGQSGTQSPVVIGSVSASDADGVAPLYSLSAGATERFSVGSASGVVSYIGTGEDYETRSDAYTLTVRATDGASAAVFTAAEVTVLISNENDNAPLFAAAPYSFTVPEGQSGTQSPVVIGSVSASDADGVVPRYSLSAGATERFSVGSASGVVSYIGTGEDYETRSDAYTLTVRATDGASAAVFTAALALRSASVWAARAGW